MSEEPKVYDISGILKGYSSFTKLPEVFQRLKDEILPEKPLQTSDAYLVFLQWSGSRGGNYGWGLYDLGEDCIGILEFYGSKTGHAPEILPSTIGYSSIVRGLDLEVSHPDFLRLTLHNSNSGIEKKVDEILADFPEKQQVPA